MRISFDLDGVLYDFHNAVYRHLVEIKEISNISYRDFWLNWVNSQSELYQDNLVKDKAIYERMIPNPDLIEKLNTLADYYDIFYITSRPDEVKFVTEKYLDKYDFPTFWNCYFCKEKHIPIIELNIDIHVDDKISHIEEVEPYCKPVLIKHPWNEAYWYKVPTYDSVLEYLDELLKNLHEVDDYNYFYSDQLYDSYRERGLL